MAEHEWEKGDAVWCWGGNYDWREGLIASIRAPDHLYPAVTLFVTVEGSTSHCTLEAVRRRDPAMKGGDKPTAESEAKRG